MAVEIEKFERGAEPGLMNTCMEDCLAHMPEESRGEVLFAWLLLGAEYTAREHGRAAALRVLNAVSDFIRKAEPSNPWPE